METRYPLGSTGIQLTPIGLGSWQFSQNKGIAGRYWPALEQTTVNEIVATTLAGGVNWFDTAEVYGWGASERSLSSALRAADASRDSYFVADKWFPALRTAGSITRTFPLREEVLAGIGVDLHQVHFRGSVSSIRAQMDRMAALYRDGKIGAIGVSNFSAAQMRAAARALDRHGLPLASNQVKFSLLDREIESNGVLETAEEFGVSIIAYSPLAQGVLTGKFHDRETIAGRTGPRRRMKRFSATGLAASRPLVDLLVQIGEDHNGASPAQIALAWTVQRFGTRILAIPGASSQNQAAANAASMQIILDESDIARIDECSHAVIATL